MKMQEMEFVNVDKMDDSLLAGNLATRALDIFNHYGDVYQTAGAYRTLAQCYFDLGDYNSALICLNNAMTKNKRVNRAPDLVASVREKLSLVYSALDNKPMSDAIKLAKRRYGMYAVSPFCEFNLFQF